MNVNRNRFRTRNDLTRSCQNENFFSEVKVELQKASWPWDPKEKGLRRYKELTDSTLVVIIAMLLLGGYVALFDFILVNVIHFFTRLH